MQLFVPVNKTKISVHYEIYPFKNVKNFYSTNSEEFIFFISCYKSHISKIYLPKNSGILIRMSTVSKAASPSAQYV